MGEGVFAAAVLLLLESGIDNVGHCGVDEDCEVGEAVAVAAACWHFANNQAGVVSPSSVSLSIAPSSIASSTASSSSSTISSSAAAVGCGAFLYADRSIASIRSFGTSFACKGVRPPVVGETAAHDPGTVEPRGVLV